MSSTARLTMGSLFGTVVTAAETASGALNTISNSVGMLNAYVENAAKQQQARFKNDETRFVKELVIEGAQAETIMEVNALAFRKKSTDHAELFDQAYKKYAKLHGLKLDDDDNVTHLCEAAE